MNRIVLNIASLAALMTLGVAAGIAFTHGLEWRNKLRLDAEQYLLVQQNLYQEFGDRAGPIEVTAILALLIATTLLFINSDRAFAYSAAALVFSVAALAIFFFGNDPVNIAVRSWTQETMPADWTAFRDQWELAHAVRAGLWTLALTAFSIATLLRTTPQEPAEQRRIPLLWDKG